MEYRNCGLHGDAAIVFGECSACLILERNKLREAHTDIVSGVKYGGWCEHDCVSTSTCALKYS